MNFSNIAEADGGTGAAGAEYVWLAGMPLAFIQSGAAYFVHTDHLNTPQRITDAAAAVVWDAAYRPFGEATVTGPLTFNLRFPGQYYDVETALHYNYYRDYDPSTGRYIQSDPIGLQGGWNTYAYVGGNPVTRLDPSGLICWRLPIPRGGIYCDGFFDDLPRKYPPIPPDCCDQEQLLLCRTLAGTSVGTSCAACAGTEGLALPQCALCGASVVEFIFVCRAQNCTICERPAQLSCNSVGSRAKS